MLQDLAGLRALGLGLLVFGFAVIVGRFVANERRPQPATVLPPESRWAAADRSGTNVSHFIYRDINRTGEYDLGDRPMAGVQVRLVRPDGRETWQVSNLRGFVNFYNAPDDTAVHVFQPGRHRLQVIPPDGWIVTSSNESQEISYVLRDDTRPGIIAMRTPAPTGLVPQMSIRGRVKGREAETNELDASAAAEPELFSIHGRGARKWSPPLDSTGHFNMALPSGTVQIRARRRGGEEVVREVTIGEVPVVVGGLFGPSEPARSGPENRDSIRVITFEEFSNAPITKVPNGRFGLKWKNLIAVANDLYGGPGYMNGTISGDFVGYNSSGYPVEIERERPFTFLGGYFSAAWPEASGESVIVTAWRDEMLLYRDQFELSYLGAVWFDAQYVGVTRVELRTAHYWQFVADDLRFTFQ